jgi:hypothetical protein
MSMNVFITAVREVTYKNKAGQVMTSEQQEVFEAFQTPTKVTYEIVDSDDPVGAYIDWVMQQYDRDEYFDVFAEDDIFGEKEPIGKEVYNSGKEHVQVFRDWIANVEDNGYRVKIEVI